MRLKRFFSRALPLALATTLFAGCVVEAEDTLSDTSSSSSSSSVITAVAISGANSISYNANATLTATVTTKDNANPTITYTWTITSGSSHAYFGTAGTTSTTTTAKTVTLTANNTTSSAQTVTVKVTATNASNSSDKAISEAFSISVSKTGETIKDELTAVSLSASSASISAMSKATLTASPTYTGSPSITYVWTITDGANYAYFTSEGEGSTTKTTTNDPDCKITGANTTESSQSVTIKVVASDAEGHSFDDSVTITVLAPAADTDTLYLNLTKAQVSPDNSKWYDISTSATTFTSDTLSVKHTKDSGISTGLIKIDATSFSGELTVNITGTMTTGGIKIQSNGTDAVNVNLNGATITSSNYQCVEVTKGSATKVVLTGTNTFVDGRSYGTGYGEEYSTSSGDTYKEDGVTYSCTVVESAVSEGSDSKGSLYSKGNLTISGSGSLKVTQGFKNCIATKAYLTIESGTFTLISTGKSGLYADQCVYVKGGSIGFTGTGAVSVSSSVYHKANGINTDDETYTNSFVNISGGSLNFAITYGKGITAPVVNISGGTNVIKVTSPTTKTLNTSASYLTADGVRTSETITFAPQGIDGGTVTVSGGTTTITAPWSGINSDGNVTIEDGTLTINTSAAGVYDSSDSDYTAPSCIKADGNIIVKGGTVTGTNGGDGGKGIKAGGSYTQSGGSVNVAATGSNLGSSSSSGNQPGGGNQPSRPGQQNSSILSSSSSASASAKGVRVTGVISITDGTLHATSKNHEAIESKSTITITGGEVYGYSAADDGINAASDFTISGGYVCGYAPNNDGLDANGNLYIKGGVVYAVGSTIPEKSIDANTEGGYKLYISGGVVMALGPLENGSSLTQSCYSASSWSANTIYGLTVGSTTYTFKTPSSTSGYGSGIVVSGSSTPTLTSGATAGSATYFDGLVSVGGTAGKTSVSLSSYSSGSSTTTGGGTTPPNNGGQQGGGFGRP